jgi:hypothetical protein
MSAIMFVRALQACLVYQLDFRPAAAASGWSSLITQEIQTVVEGLVAGTKYSFRSRGGYGTQDTVKQLLSGAGSSGGQAEGLTWGEFSVESSYVTSGTCVHHPRQLLARLLLCPTLLILVSTVLCLCSLAPCLAVS